MLWHKASKNSEDFSTDTDYKLNQIQILVTVLQWVKRPRPSQKLYTSYLNIKIQTLKYL